MAGRIVWVRPVTVPVTVGSTLPVRPVTVGSRLPVSPVTVGSRLPGQAGDRREECPGDSGDGTRDGRQEWRAALATVPVTAGRTVAVRPVAVRVTPVTA